MQMLNGEPPSHAPAVIVDLVPGTQFRYSNYGYSVIQQAIIDVTGKSFPEVADELVLKPSSMKNSTFSQRAPGDMVKGIALGHDESGKALEGGWHQYPEMAAGGLWSTAEDLAYFIIAIQKSYHGESGAILRPVTIHDALKPLIENAAFADRYGLGFQVIGDPEAGSLIFWHAGGIPGFDSYYFGDVVTGQGAAIIINKKGAGDLMKELINDIRLELSPKE